MNCLGIFSTVQKHIGPENCKLKQKYSIKEQNKNDVHNYLQNISDKLLHIFTLYCNKTFHFI